MEQNQIKELVTQMTLEEKAKFFTGSDFWHTESLERLGIPAMLVTDGPHGLRKQVKAVDHLGLSESKTAICFPSGSALAASFNPELAEKVGSELGKLASAEHVGVILGPAMNIKRSPLCGRNFEYLSEDPYVSGRMAAGLVKGIQGEHVGACPKHFLANNQEYYRMTSNSVVDERTLREIYLPGFEQMVKESDPDSIMCSYNKINGTYASENKKFLTDILRDEWNFDGFVMTDWGACDDPVESIKAGLDLAMPGPAEENVKKIREAVESGELDEKILDRAVERVLRSVLQAKEMEGQEKAYDYETGHETAKQAEAECAVLLKNEDQMLPLKRGEKVLFVGAYGKQPRYQGGGSSHINPYKVSSAWEQVKELDGISYADGFLDSQNGEMKEELLERAVLAAREADKVVIFAGLPDSYETEGMDRKHLDLPAEQNRLIFEIAKTAKHTAVVLHNGAPVAMPWIGEVDAVLEAYLGGEAVGEAVADLLYGAVSPSGRLAETFPARIEDTPCYPYFGVEKEDVVYREGIMVGYRHYETMKKDVLFPFGHGLSYSHFSYRNLHVDQTEVTDQDTVQVSVDVTNDGVMKAKEVVQLYVERRSGEVVRPVRELRGFQKIELESGETKTVSFCLDKRSFAYWNEDAGDWMVETGEHMIQIGRSAHEIILQVPVHVTSTSKYRPLYTINTPIGVFMQDPDARRVIGGILGKMMEGKKKEESEKEEEEDGVLSKEATDATANATPLRSLLSFGRNITLKEMQDAVELLNADRR